MRVGFVTEQTVFTESTAGRERMHRIASNLADAGHDVTVYCTRWWDDYDEFHHRDGVTYRAVTAEPARSSFLARVPVLLAADRPDVVHTLPTPPRQVVAANLGGTLARAPVVVEWFGDEDLDGDERFVRYAARRPDLVVTPSELVRTVVRELGASEDATAVIPESIDMSLIERTEPADSSDVVYARRLDDDANVDTLLLGLAELRDRGWTATVIGDGPEREAYERQARDLRIDDRVEFVGDLDREERVAAYKGAHVFVQTAYRENFATELCWALACGCVGIVEYQAESSAHELIETYDRGFRVTDDEELAEAIVDAGGFERMEMDSRLAEYDHGEVLEEYLDRYQSLLADRGLF